MEFAVIASGVNSCVEFAELLLMKPSICESTVSSCRKVWECKTLNRVGLVVSSLIALNLPPICFDIVAYYILLFQMPSLSVGISEIPGTDVGFIIEKKEKEKNTKKKFMYC